MKVVINKCYGGFSLSKKAVVMLAEMNGRKAYFFTGGCDRPYRPISIEDGSLFWTAFDIPNPNEVLGSEPSWSNRSDEAHKKFNEEYSAHFIESGRDIDRSDPRLIRIVETLGVEANGSCAQLEIVEIPDDVKFAIEEYDGIEWVSEEHRTWS